MRFSEAWLRELVNPNIDTQAIADQLSMAGLEVGAIIPVAGVFTGVVIGSVQTVESHPSADKLRICQVQTDATNTTSLQIVCGAANVAAGQRVPVALVGAVLPEDMRIKPAKLRGVESFGMICSASELGLEEKSSGILVLPEDAPVGENLRSYLKLDDKAIEVELTPDRGDCLSLIGIAREVGVINRIAINPLAIEPIPPLTNYSYQVQITAPDACPRYACRVIEEINPTAQTPLWMRERLRRSGIRAINPVVDITNYVMLELGQPMHGFDLATLDQRIEVRLALEEERITLLDGRNVPINADTLVIADATRPLALAGIMGGDLSGVNVNTRSVLLESAFFTPLAISGKPRIYGLATDSSHRFERGVDPGLQVLAIERATKLLLDIAGGKPGPIVDIQSSEHLPKTKTITIRRQRIQRVLGMVINDAEIVNIFALLGMHTLPTQDGWQVSIPTARFDISIEVDLIAELGRIYGYAKVPIHHAVVDTALAPLPETRFDVDKAKDLLINRGYQEVITYSFVSAEIQELTDPGAKTVALSNPLSKDLAVMRTGLWPGLLLTASYNQSRQWPRVRIFESGLGFIEASGLKQIPMLAGLATGSIFPEQWGCTVQPVDFFDVKSDVEALLGLLKLDNINFIVAEHPALHPGKCARILRHAETIGWIGALHPKIQQQLDFTADVVLFELHLPLILTGQLPTFKPLSKFPSTRRDIAIIVDQLVSSATIVNCIRQGRQEILQDILLFDVYTGNLDPGQKSLAIGLVLQDFSCTLSDASVNAVIADILQSLKDGCGAVLRT